MLCAISGEAPQVPVASKKSGAIFEKRLIEAYIAEHGRDPVTNDDLTVEDLVDIRTDRTVKPRPPQLTSIPSLLSVFQNEWDALALEHFNVQQQLEQTRRELSRALYESDAALRVIARVSKERDEARDALSRLSINGHAGASADKAFSAVQTLPSELASAVATTQEALSKTRRKRPIPEEWVDSEAIGGFKAQKLDDAGQPTSRFISRHPEKGQLLHVAGQPAGSIAVFDAETSQSTTLSTAQGGQVTDAAWTQKGSIVVGSATGHLCIQELGGPPPFVRQSHTAEVTSVSVHASGRILASTSLDKTIVFYDAESGTPVSQLRTEAPLTTGAFHPDGHIFAAGSTDGELKIYETASGTRAATFALGGAVETCSFSENGTWLAASIKGDSAAQIWDLRKGTAIHSVTAPGDITALAWDYTGQFLAVGSTMGVAVHTYEKASKAWGQSLKSDTPAVAITWGTNARSLYCMGLEGAITELA